MRKFLMICAMSCALTGCGAVKAIDTGLHCVPPMTGGCPLGQTKHR